MKSHSRRERLTARVNMGKVVVHWSGKWIDVYNGKGKGKAARLQAWSGPEGSRKLRFPDLMTTAQDGGKIVNPTPRPHLLPGNIRGTRFC
jgi:hypothetical protein